MNLFFWFQVIKEEDLELIESSLWFDMIERFVNSKEFNSPFTLRLLASALISALENPNTNVEYKKTDVKNPKIVEDSNFEIVEPKKSLEKEEVILYSDKTKTEKSDKSEFSRIENDSGDVSSTTIHKNLNDGFESSKWASQNLELSQKESNSVDLSTEQKKHLKLIPGQLDNSLDLKKNFFRSDSEDSDTDYSTESKKTYTKRKTTIKSDGADKKSKNLTKNNNIDDDEGKKLQQLLRLTSYTFNAQNRGRDSEQEEDKSIERKSSRKKPNEEKQNLLDFIDHEKTSESYCESDKEDDNEKIEINEDFEAQINDEVKFSFLLSSSEEITNSECGEENKKVRKKIKKKKLKKDKVKQRKNDDLRLFSVPSFGSDNEKEGETDESKGSATEEKEGDTNESIGWATEEKEEDTDESKGWATEEKEEETDESKGCAAEDKDSIIIKEEDKWSSSTEPERKYKPGKFLQEVSYEVSTDSDSPQISVRKSQDSPSKGRKNINKILKKDCLEVGTKQARKMEAERKKRLAERQEAFAEIMSLSNNSKLVLDFDLETKEELLVVDEELASKLKPHQRDGVKFMWNSCFESLKRLEEDSGSGCILAHCMGLGKTLQVITLVHTILTNNTGVKTVIILCPVNTIKNWLREFKVWLENCKEKVTLFEIASRKTPDEKASEIKRWTQTGGVFIMGYEIFRLMMTLKKFKYEYFPKAFLNPGPDLVVCDEGHLLKNRNSLLSKCLSKMKTLRRIVLTGTPLQNNLLEYYSMVQFVKPNILGTKKEFMNGFVNPIKNGQFEDSTQTDVRIMKRRAHVLHSLLDGFIQRCGYYVLTPFLPEKQEYVISVSLTKTQDKLYRMFVEKKSCGFKEADCQSDSLLNDYHWLQKVWTHPRILANIKCKMQTQEGKKNDWKELIDPEEYEDVRGSGKLFLLFQILKSCRQIGDKILVFSQFISTLNLIEHFLKQANSHFQNKRNFEFADSWILDQDYFRMDGKTNCKKRHECCKKFNDKKNKRARLFLISTRAGGLGINLVAANRVVIFDASWNPSHDVQSIFRVYRFGQNKPCYIYRFLAEATIEEKIYKRQVTKLSLAYRILDEHQIERHYSMMNLQELYSYNPTPKEAWKIPKVPKDNLFAKILVSNKDIIVGYHEHDSLLENKEAEELTEEERRAAWEDFEKERIQPTVPSLPRTSNAIQSAYMEVVNKEALQMVHSYKQGLMKNFEQAMGRGNFVLNEGQDQMCKIVDVRTLNSQETKTMNLGDENELLKVGRSIGFSPLPGENVCSFRLRVLRALRQMCP